MYGYKFDRKWAEYIPMFYHEQFTRVNPNLTLTRSNKGSKKQRDNVENELPKSQNGNVPNKRWKRPKVKFENTPPKKLVQKTDLDPVSLVFTELPAFEGEPLPPLLGYGLESILFEA